MCNLFVINYMCYLCSIYGHNAVSVTSAPSAPKAPSAQAESSSKLPLMICYLPITARHFTIMRSHIFARVDIYF